MEPNSARLHGADGVGRGEDRRGLRGQLDFQQIRLHSRRSESREAFALRLSAGLEKPVEVAEP